MSEFIHVIQFLAERKLRLVTAESCTAGMITSLLANTPGCGQVLDIGFVVYTEAAKHHCLKVNIQTMKVFGLTSEEVALEMARGALDTSQSDIAIAVTGTAESDDDLNGVVCFGYAVRSAGKVVTRSETCKFNGERNYVRKAAAEHAIMSLPTIYQELSQ